MRVNRYRIWLGRYGPYRARLWLVAMDRGDGRRGHPFIYAHSCAAAMTKLAHRIEVRRKQIERRRKPAMHRPCKN